jgi:hypothetical protein
LVSCVGSSENSGNLKKEAHTYEKCIEKEKKMSNLKFQCYRTFSMISGYMAQS